MGKNQDFSGLPALEEEHVKNALDFLEKHAKDLDNRSFMLDIPPGTKNGELNALVKGKILGEAETLRQRLGIPRDFEEKE